MTAKAYYPGSKYVPLSVSGTVCYLSCKGCNAAYLEGMIDVSDPEKLRLVLSELYRQGVRGYLLSGGYSKDGYLLIRNEHLKVVKNFLRDHEAVFSTHLGLAPRDLLHSVWSAGVDVIDFEVPPSNDYLKHVKGLGHHSVNDYLEFAAYIRDTYGKDFIAPHLILDSTYATPEEEQRMIKAIAELDPYVFVALVEIRRTNNDEGRVKDALRLARMSFREVALGCMRSPRFKALDEVWLRECLVDRIAVPKPALVREYDLQVIKACCSLKPKYEHLFA